MSKNNKVNEDPGQDLMAANGGALFGQLLKTAINKLDGEGAESVVAVIERLVDLKTKVDQTEAEKEFNKALAEFQNECPQIKKTSESGKGATQSGNAFSYMYAELDEIQKTIKPLLYPRGFSFTWDTKTTYNGDRPVLECTCLLRHRNGHFATANFSVPVTKEVGSMNEVQRHSAVKTYAKRQTLVDILGLTTTEGDTDGVSPETISKEEASALETRAKDATPNVDKFLEYMGVKAFTEIRKVDHAKAILALEQKKKKIQAESE